MLCKLHCRTCYEAYVIALAIKSELVEIDEFDTGPQAIFNYGHTFGHVLEKCSQTYLPHGVAVLIGVLCAEEHKLLIIH